MQWSGKIPNNGLTPRKRERKEREQLEARVNDSLADNPAFQVYTVDGTCWICPYTCTLVPCTPGNTQLVRQFLLNHKPWTTGRRNGNHRPLFLVLEQKWTQHLSTTPEVRFQQFAADGRWQNPFTKAWVLLPHARTITDKQAIAEIAHVLAGCLEARDMGNLEGSNCSSTN